MPRLIRVALLFILLLVPLSFAEILVNPVESVDAIRMEGKVERSIAKQYESGKPLVSIGLPGKSVSIEPKETASISIDSRASVVTDADNAEVTYVDFYGRGYNLTYQDLGTKIKETITIPDSPTTTSGKIEFSFAIPNAGDNFQIKNGRVFMRGGNKTIVAIIERPFITDGVDTEYLEPTYDGETYVVTVTRRWLDTHTGPFILDPTVVYDNFNDGIINTNIWQYATYNSDSTYSFTNLLETGGYLNAATVSHCPYGGTGYEIRNSINITATGPSAVDFRADSSLNNITFNGTIYLATGTGSGVQSNTVVITDGNGLDANLYTQTTAYTPAINQNYTVVFNKTHNTVDFYINATKVTSALSISALNKWYIGFRVLTTWSSSCDCGSLCVGGYGPTPGQNGFNIDNINYIGNMVFLNQSLNVTNATAASQTAWRAGNVSYVPSDYRKGVVVQFNTNIRGNCTVSNETGTYAAVSAISTKYKCPQTNETSFSCSFDDDNQSIYTNRSIYVACSDGSTDSQGGPFLLQLVPSCHSVDQCFNNLIAFWQFTNYSANYVYGYETEDFARYDQALYPVINRSASISYSCFYGLDGTYTGTCGTLTTSGVRSSPGFVGNTTSYNFTMFNGTATAKATGITSANTNTMSTAVWARLKNMTTPSAGEVSSAVFMLTNNTAGTNHSVSLVYVKKSNGDVFAKYLWEVDQQPYSATCTLNENASDWHHFAFTIDSVMSTMYVDGQSCVTGSGVALGNLPRGKYNLTLGYAVESTAYNAVVDIDELYIYNGTPWFAQNILDLYQATKPAVISNNVTFGQNSSTALRSLLNLNIANNWTVEFRATVSPSPDTYSTLLKYGTSNNMVNIWSRSDGVLGVVLADSAGTTFKNYTVPAAQDSTPRHFVVAWDGTTLRIFVNGAAATATKTTDSSGTMTQTARNLSIGDSGAWTERLNGSIEYVRVYNRSMSTSDAYWMYMLGEAYTPHTAQIFDETDGTQFSDNYTDQYVYAVSCPSGEEQYITTQNQTIIPGICANFTRVRLTLFYPGGATYYRTLFMNGSSAALVNITFYAVESAASVIQETLSVVDILSSYKNVSLWVSRQIGGVWTDITADNIDAAGRTTAYLMQSAEYRITVKSSTQPDRILGTITPTAPESIIFRLFDIDLTPTASGMSNDVSYTTGIYNVSGPWHLYAYLRYSDANQSTTNTTWSLYNGTTLLYNVTTTSQNYSATYLIDSYANDTLRSVLTINRNGEVFVYEPTINWFMFVDRALPLLAYIPEANTNVGWFLLLLMGGIALLFGIGTGTLGAAVVAAIGIVLSLSGSWAIGLTASVLAFIIVGFNYFIMQGRQAQ